MKKTIFIFFLIFVVYMPLFSMKKVATLFEKIAINIAKKEKFSFDQLKKTTKEELQKKRNQKKICSQKEILALQKIYNYLKKEKEIEIKKLEI
ncbi:hypothetical protein KAH94_04710, partial [bacterium]|nr:hypothetical protein [bacterium]